MLCFVVFLAIVGSCLGDDRFSDSYRIEIELIQLETNGVDENNKKCDAGGVIGLGQCDPVIVAFIDIGTPSKPFVSASTNTIVFSKDNVDNPVVNKVVAKDVCGGATTTITLRAYVYDAETDKSQKRIDDFDCSFVVAPKDVAELDLGAHANWGMQINCIAKTLPQKHKLTARMRAYSINVPNCRIDDDMFSLQQTWIRGMKAPKVVPFQPNQRPNIRLEVGFVQLTNLAGVTQKGAACGTGTAPCHPLLMFRLDTDTPMAKPDRTGADTVGFLELSKFSATNSPKLDDKTVFRDICGGALNWVMVRVIVKNAPGIVDIKNWNNNPTIEDFECISRIDYSTIANSREASSWGPTQSCIHLNPSDISLQFRIRAYAIPPDQCMVGTYTFFNNVPAQG